MTKIYLQNLLQKELERLNDLIDEKIIRGLPYGKEARRHKFLTARLMSVRKQERGNIFFRKFLISNF